MNTNTTSNDFIGKRIAISREQMKVSRFELADKMCLSRSIVGKWERGISNPSIAHLVKLASVLGVSFEWLATGVKNDDEFDLQTDNISEQEQHKQHKIKVAKVGSFMAKMTPKQQDSLVSFLGDISA
jgi:transcriptional regulator with XRE-family HTH domain